MPVSDAFRSRREGKRGLRTFCGFCPAANSQGRPSARRMETVPGYCDRAMEPETYALRKCGVCGRLAIGRRRRHGQPFLRRIEITLTVVLSSGGRSPRWLTSANPGAGRLRSGRLREITDERTISDFAVGACCPRRCPLWHQDGRPELRIIRACGSADRWPLPAAPRRTQPNRRRPTALFCTHFARRIHRRALQLTAVTGTRASVPQSTRTAVQGPCMRGKSAPGSRSLPKFGACRSAAITGTARGPVARPARPSRPMCLSGLAYHRRDNMTGQIRA
jgi:hypothetical protein